MPTIDGLPAIDLADVSDDDILPIWDTTAPSGNTKRVTRANLLSSVGTVTIADLTATLVSSMTFTGGGGMTDMVSADIAITISALAAGATEDKTGTLTGAATTDLLLHSFTSGLEAGVLVQAWISGADTVTFRVTNTTSSGISGGSVTARCVAITLV